MDAAGLSGWVALAGGSLQRIHAAIGVLPPRALVLGAATLLLVWVARTRAPNVRAYHRRGARVRTYPRALRLAHQLSRARALRLAGVPIRPDEECKHFKLIGTTGTGKSTAIRALIAAALARGDRAIISDPDGGYLRQLGQRQRGDCLLNPFEAHSARWDLFAELQERYDPAQLASALIADTQDAAAQEWRGYARTLLTALIRRCWERGEDLARLWQLLSIAPAEKLRAWLQETPAQPFVEADNVRLLGSIRSVASSALAALEYLPAHRGTPLSIRAWVRSGSGVLFLPYRAGQIAALRSLIAAWLKLAIFETLQGEEGVDQRLWFVVDELDALGAIQGLKDALARLRKFGGRCVLGLQSIAQVSGTYGYAEAQTIVENCANTLILRCGGSEQGGTSQFAARLIGEREVLRAQRARGREAAGWWGAPARRSLQLSEQLVVESAVLASELEQLPDHAGYLKTASSRCWWRLHLP
jgi:type IV secretory pathway TraG/TraD family ATPase VirD4